ncbi:MAG: bifunctional phosphoserine phosphatase/homoserine phosphotransferase ThrH [Propionibacteriaceae bacterium]|jgi:phosphoserine/homoserine phosphotransferase|nr:bifunctional phosphoserine phosphatase/homoserine phosphotransferase ThrH [Propionibacteriaceae bacterium]
MAMEIVCLDLEGVLVPEIWINVAAKTGVDQLKLTTRDISDYDQLMRHRLAVLERHGLTLADLQAVIATMAPLPGAVEFLAWLRRGFQVVILSDTFYDFARPLMVQLDQPVLFCHDLTVDQAGRVADYRLRLPDQKRAAVRAFQGLNFTVFAAGDSYNDTAMLNQADLGLLFDPPDKVVAEFPHLPVTRNYQELAERLRAASSRPLSGL